MKSIRNSLIAFACAAGAFAFAPANADSISPANNTGLCLDMGSKTDLQPCRRDADQDFQFDREGRLRVEGGCLAVSREYEPLFVARCGRGAENRWSYDRSGSLVNGTGLCADVNKGQVRAGELVIAYRCTGKANQRWSVGGNSNPGYPSDNDGGYDGGYGNVLLSPQHAPGKCLDVRRGSTDLIIFGCHGRSNQQFEYVEGRRGGQLKVGGNCVTAPRNEGESLYIARCGNSSSQRWELGRDGSLQSGAGGCADVADRGTRDNTPVILYRCTGASNQRFNAQSR